MCNFNTFIAHHFSNTQRTKDAISLQYGYGKTYFHLIIKECRNISVLNWNELPLCCFQIIYRMYYSLNWNGLNIVPLRFVYAFMRKLCFTLIVSISFWKKYVIGETKIDDWNDRTFGHIAKYRSQRMILDDTLTQDTLA